MNRFKNNTTAFSDENAYWLAFCSQLAYAESSAVDRELTALGMTSIIFIDERDTQAIITADADKMIISIRGTDGLKDAMTDIDIDLVDGVGGRVHEGFNIATSHIWRDVWKAIEMRGNRSLFITGHSLGAGIATIIAAKLVQQKDEPVNGLYTYGSPRVGDKEFEKNFNASFGKRTFRYVNNNDIVTRTPFRSMGYRHVGELKYFDENGQLRKDIQWWQKLLDRIHGRLDDVFELGTDGIKDHSISEYVNRTGKASC